MYGNAQVKRIGLNNRNSSSCSTLDLPYLFHSSHLGHVRALAHFVILHTKYLHIHLAQTSAGSMHIYSALLKFTSHLHESLNISMPSYVYFPSMYLQTPHLISSKPIYIYLSVYLLQLSNYNSSHLSPSNKKCQIEISSVL